MIALQINGLDFISKPYISILEACKTVGITAPRFCYHETLSIAGNCRMCLVEIEGMEKPVASCVTEVEEKMSIKVDSAFAKKARENVVEAILLNHPLDCPICDQAGECDLQDQAKSFGANHSRFFFPKSSVEDKYCGSLVKTIMTRCIKCTRCVRYAEEISGNASLGTLNRGVHSEIGGYKSNLLKSEISGNIVDLCPVGALTSKTYAFQARPWELRVAESFSVADSYGANIYVNYRGSDILRILPKNNIKLNNSLITDKTRYSHDSNYYGRLRQSYIIDKNSLKTTVLDNTFPKISNKSNNIYVNQENDLDTLFSVINSQNSSKAATRVIDLDSIYNSDNSCLPYLQKNISEKIESLVILLGTNLKLENALLNARLRHKYKNSLLKVLLTGSGEKTTFPSLTICSHIKNIINLFEGRNALFSRLVNNVSSFTLLVGESFYHRAKSADFCIYSLKRFFKNAFIFKIYLYANSAGTKLLNVRRLPVEKKSTPANIAINLRSNYLATLTTKEIQTQNFASSYLLTSHGSQNALNFNKIIPICDNFETSRNFINLEYNLIKTAKVWEQNKTFANSPHFILSGLLGNCNPPKIEKTRPKWFSYLENAKGSNQAPASNIFTLSFDINKSFVVSNKTKCFKYFTKTPIKDFHLSSFESKNSKVMQTCSKESHALFTNFTPFSRKN